MPETYEDERAAAIAAVREAATLCRAVQQQISPDVLQKKDRSPVTVADFGSQALVCRRLCDAFAGDPVIAEEDSAALHEPDNAPLLERMVAHVNDVIPGTSADQVCEWIDHGGAQDYADRFWTLDPIDGTKGFIRSEQYAISLALIVEGQIAVAALGCPNLPRSPGTSETGALFTAVRGAGAQVQSLWDEGPAETIRISNTPDPQSARFCESVESGHTSHDTSARIAEQLQITNPSVRLDSQAKYAVVARGEADIYLRLPTRKDYVERIWDHAGGVLVVEEAGGMVTDVTGCPLEFNHGAGLEANKGVIVTNGRLHEPVVEAVRRVLEI